MKFKLKSITVAIALATLAGSQAASANGEDEVSFENEVEYHKNVTNDIDTDYTADHEANSKVVLNKTIDIEHDILYTGTVNVEGTIVVTGASAAVINDEQLNYNNDGDNIVVDNTASLGNNALSEASGNIGVNITAGDNNMQDNAAAIATADAHLVFGSADAEVFSFQDGQNNFTIYTGNLNEATISGAALTNATGNIGVNVSAGNNNLQKNNMAVSTANAVLAHATVTVTQLADNNTTINEPIEPLFENYEVDLWGTSDGIYDGHSEQSGDIYPDIWTDEHGFGSSIGHVDLDSEVDGAEDHHNDGGALSFLEHGDVYLDTHVSGNIPVLVNWDRRTINTASIGNTVLMNAAGNIGVNVAAGTGNMQNNSLALAASTGLVAGRNE